MLRLIAGGLTATTGRIDTPGDVDYLQQTLILGINAAVADLPGITEKVTALHAIESGDVAEHHFDVLGDDWDIETRADEALRHIRLTKADLDRRASEVSGGETLLIALAGVRLRRAPITLLDEPTINLDRESRARPADLVRSWAGSLVVVSHDDALLTRVNLTTTLTLDQAGVLTELRSPPR